jgi:hypothetical protein
MAGNKYQIKLILDRALTEDDRYEVYSKIIVDNHLNRIGFLFEDHKFPDDKSGVIEVKVYSHVKEDKEILKEMEDIFSKYGEFSIEKASAEKA